MARKDRYKNSPTLARDEESGKMTPTQKKSEEVNSGTEGVAHEEGVPAHARHAHERRDMYNRHETEHMMHDHGGHGEKEELHTRHEKERKDMHSRHEKELTGEGGGHMGKHHEGKKEEKKEEKKESKGSGDGKEKIEKVEEKKE